MIFYAYKCMYTYITMVMGICHRRGGIVHVKAVSSCSEATYRSSMPSFPCKVEGTELQRQTSPRGRTVANSSRTTSFFKCRCLLMVASCATWLLHFLSDCNKANTDLLLLPPLLHPTLPRTQLPHRRPLGPSLCTL